VRARVQWRLSIGNQNDGRDAIELVDTLLTRQRTAAHFMSRAAAGALASDTKLAWAAIEEAIRPGRGTERVRISALALGRLLGEPPPESVVFKQLSAARPQNVQPAAARPTAKADARTLNFE
jgi:hypothetical protein